MTDESLFHRALDLPPEQRAAFLDRECADADLRQQLDLMLHAHANPGSFLRALVGGTVDDLTERPGTVIGPYKLLQQIGEGGFGVVYMAEQEQPVRRKVALKIIKPGMDSKQVVARFEAERQALAMMDHPNIARVFDGGTTESGRPYFVMELVHGIPITRFCDETKLTPRERLELFIPVCHAIQHAHQKGIIHRDVKPSNVLVTMYDDKPVPKVIDFGVAKAIEQKLTDRTMFTQFGALVGTFEYMSPEQAEMNALGVDTRSDIYSLGVLLYELLTGTTPLEKERLRDAALGELVRLIKEEEPPRPSVRLSTSATLPKVAAARKTDPAQLSRLVRGEIDWIVMKCLEKDRTRRYETANGLARDVQRFLTDEAVEACPPSAGYRLRKFVRRNKGRVVAAAVAAACLVAGMVLATAGLVEARRQRDVAEHSRHEAERQREEAEDQRKRAEDAEKRARDEAEAAKAVRDFLQNDLLRQASLLHQVESRADIGGGDDFLRNPTIHELLDRAAAELTPDKIEAKFPNLPFVQAEALKAVGDAYTGVVPSKAIEPLKRAVELYRAVRGPDDPATLAARHSLGVLYFGLDERAEAAAILEAVRDDRARVLGPFAPATFATRDYLGRTYLMAGRPADALAFFDQLRDDARVHLGPDHEQTWKAVFHRGIALQEAGKLDEAIREYLAVSNAARRMNVRPDHPYALVGMRQLGSAYKAAGRPGDMIAHYERWLADAERQAAPESPASWAVRQDLGRAYSLTNRAADALAMFEKNAKSASPPHDVTALAAAAQLYRDSGRAADAIPLYEKARDLLVQRKGPNDTRTLDMVWQLGSAYRAAGRMRDAIAVLDTALRQAHPESLVAWQIRHQLGWAYSGERRYADAIATFEQNLKFSQRPQDTVSMVALAQLYHTAGRSAEAVPLYEKARDLRTERRGPTDPDTLDAVRRLADVYLAVGRTEQALPLLEETVRQMVAARGPDNLEVLRERQSLGTAYAKVGKDAEAVPVLDDVVRRFRATTGEATERTFGAMIALRNAHSWAGRYDRAAEVAADGIAVRRKHKNLPPSGLAGDLGARGFFLLQAGKPAEAEPVLRESLDAWAKANPTAPNAVASRASLGIALQRQKKYAEAEPTLLAAYRELGEKIASMPEWYQDKPAAVAGSLAELYTALNKPEDAAKWRKEMTARAVAAKPLDIK